ncbi:Arpin [Bagarius yarrelli]|uniref:Arpin n=1 Tax=Bagarius yarrelli TaxID=175774 RepID=A0A556V301_BAGYA|nr:Arpin [Bagarius yarrelli]
MSRIYDNSALQNKPVHSEKLSFAWDPSVHQRCVITSCTLSRVESTAEYDSKGNEIEPNFSESRKVNTGYLMSSYKLEAKGESDCLTEEQLKSKVNKNELLSITKKHCPDQAFAFWILEAELEKTELEIGQDIRIKTKGDGPFIFSFAKLDAGTVTKCNFAGDEAAGTSWTDKIMANKADAASKAKPSALGEGAEEDEWVR